MTTPEALKLAREALHEARQLLATLGRVSDCASHHTARAAAMSDRITEALIGLDALAALPAPSGEPTDGAIYAAVSEATSPDWHAGFRAGMSAGVACAQAAPAAQAGHHFPDAGNMVAPAPQAASPAPAVPAEPAAWLVRNGRAFVDRPFISRAAAEESAAKRSDGAEVVPLYAGASPAPAVPATINRYCRAGMCVATDARHEPGCNAHASSIPQQAPVAAPAPAVPADADDDDERPTLAGAIITIKTAHDESLDDSHKAARALLREAVEGLEALAAAPHPAQTEGRDG